MGGEWRDVKDGFKIGEKRGEKKRKESGQDKDTSRNFILALNYKKFISFLYPKFYNFTRKFLKTPN